MNSRGCRSVKCLHASSLNLVPADIKALIHTCLWGVWGSGFLQPSVKCWMHLHHQANTEEKLFMCHLQGTSPPVWHLWKDMVFINNENFTYFMPQRPNSASKEHILIQVMLRHHGKMTVFVLKHSASSSAPRAVKYKKGWFWVSIKSRSGFMANCIWGYVGLNWHSDYFQNNLASISLPFGLNITTMLQFWQICQVK